MCPEFEHIFSITGAGENKTGGRDLATPVRSFRPRRQAWRGGEEEAVGQSSNGQIVKSLKPLKSFKSKKSLIHSIVNQLISTR